jgi:recombination protein RecT
MSNQQLAMVKKDTVDVVAEKVKQFQESGELHFPASFSPENAMKSAWLMLQDTKDRSGNLALQSCTKDSIANSLLDMVVQGLNPAKKQGYFIVYGNKLTFQRSYFGTMAVTKRVTGAKEINATVIYKGDIVNYEMQNGKIVNLTHKQEFGNIDKGNILGAYCTIVMGDGSVNTTLMTMAEITQAWKKSQMWKSGDKPKEGSTHDEFTQEMAKKTVINRACKTFLNSSDDGSLVMSHINGQEDDELEAQAEIDQNANKDVLDMEYEDVTDKPQPEQPEVIDAEYTEEQPVGGPDF